MFGNLKQLNVGDLAAYETQAREQKRKELIATFKDLYGDKLPDDAVFKINRELKSVKGIFSDDEVEIDATVVQFLLWRSVRKSQPDITLEQVGEEMDMDKLGEYVESIMPSQQSVGESDKKKPDSQ